MTFRLTLKKVVHFDNQFSFYNDTIRMFILVDENGHKYVWKTAGRAEYADYTPVCTGDTFVCEATVKEVTTYKGEEQTVLTRCRKFELVSHNADDAAVKQFERDEETAEKQLATLSDGDIVMTLDYARYKKHYADCEKVAGSYRAFGRDKEIQLIDVIVRKGRLVNSGVRGKHYNMFCFFDANENKSENLIAISETTARRRLPAGKWELIDVKEKNCRGFWG